MGQLDRKALAGWWAVYTLMIVWVSSVSVGSFTLFGLALGMLGAVPAALITWCRRDLPGK